MYHFIKQSLQIGIRKEVNRLIRIRFPYNISCNNYKVVNI